MFGRLRRYFITGILALLPVGITAWVLVKVFVTIDQTVRPWTAKWAARWAQEWYGEIPGLGVVITILFVLATGLFASNIIGRTIIGGFESLFARVPLFSRIYTAVKQIGDGVIGREKNLFQRVILFEYPRKECWAIGFVTSEHRGELANRFGKEFVHVFVPTTPNPTSGFLLFLPVSDVIDLDMDVEDGLKLVISGGAVAPPIEQAVSSKQEPGDKPSPRKVTATKGS